MSDKDTLLSMGFDPARVDWAIHATTGRGLQPAMDHVLANQDNPIPDYKNAPAASSGGKAGSDEYDAEDEAALASMLAKSGQKAQDDMVTDAAAAKSIKCTECGKILKSAAFASFHAEKSGHTQFEESTEEIKPLTEEEKKAKLEDLRQKLAAKRANKSKEDAAEAKANEIIRRKAGQDVGEAREEMKRKEQIREAEKKKREKIEDAAAKARVKAQIEADKRERAERTAREKALREGRAPPSDSAPVNVATPTAAAAGAGASASTAAEARLRVRAPGGMWQGILPADATLAQLEQKVVEEGKAGAAALKFSTTFPRKIFSDADKARTLRELGLVPNAALEASAA